MCYLHPEDAGKMLKIVKPWKRAGYKRKDAPWFKRMRPASCFDDNLLELKAFAFLEKKANVNRHFPRCFGVVETDLGEALCVEYIRSEGVGGGSLTLEEYLKRNGFTDEIRTALNELCRFLYDNLIITRDLRSFNIVVRRIETGLNLVIVDGLGNPEFIPVSNVIPWFGRRKLQRKFLRFRQRLERIAGESGWTVPDFG